MAGFKVGYFVGSLAAKSTNRSLAKALVTVARSNGFDVARPSATALALPQCNGAT
jgi:NAD(P)H-dependent FMN reductase